MDTPDTSPKSPFPTLRVVTILIIIAAGAGYARYAFMQHAGSQQATENISVLEVRLQNLDNNIMLHEKRIAKLEDDTQKLAAAASKPAPGVLAAPATPDQEKRLAALEKQIATLHPAALQQQDNAQVYEAIHLLSALHHFSDKVLSGKPYAAEFASFEELVGDNTDIAKSLSALVPYAETGIPTFAQLLASFDESVTQLNVSEASPPPDAGLWARFFYTLTHLVSVRKIDDAQAGNSADAIVARAEAHLEREEIEAAVAEIKSLPENARSNFSAWLEEAEIATATPTIMDEVEEQVMQKAFHTEAPKPPAKDH